MPKFKKKLLKTLKKLPRDRDERINIGVHLYDTLDTHPTRGISDRFLSLYTCLGSSGLVMHTVSLRSPSRDLNPQWVRTAVVDALVKCGIIPGAICTNLGYALRCIAPLFAALGGVALEHSECTGEMMELIESAMPHVPWNNDRPGLLDMPGVAVDDLAFLASAAAAFHRSSAWHALHTGNIWELCPPPLLYDEQAIIYVQVLGKGGRCPPMVNIFFDPRSINALQQAEGGAKTGHLSFSLCSFEDVEFIDLDAIHAYEIPIAAPAAYPTLLHCSVGATKISSRLPTAREIALMGWVVHTMVAFTSHDASMTGERPCLPLHMAPYSRADEKYYTPFLNRVADPARNTEDRHDASPRVSVKPFGELYDTSRVEKRMSNATLAAMQTCNSSLAKDSAVKFVPPHGPGKVSFSKAGCRASLQVSLLEAMRGEAPGPGRWAYEAAVRMSPIRDRRGHATPATVNHDTPLPGSAAWADPAVGVADETRYKDVAVATDTPRKYDHLCCSWCARFGWQLQRESGPTIPGSILTLTGLSKESLNGRSVRVCGEQTTSPNPSRICVRLPLVENGSYDVGGKTVAVKPSNLAGARDAQVMKQCAGCRQAAYCCAEHQKLDWSTPTRRHRCTEREPENHKSRCKALKRANKDRRRKKTKGNMTEEERNIAATAAGDGSGSRVDDIRDEQISDAANNVMNIIGPHLQAWATVSLLFIFVLSHD